MRDVVGYENIYGITSCGRVWSYKNKRFLTPSTTKKGYLKVNLCKNGKCKTYKVHRLVAEAYIPNPDNLPQVDHIDNDKTHNYINNLQWITNIENCRKSHNKPILQFTLDGELVHEWSSATEVGKEVQSNICKCLKGRKPTAYGYKWFYKE